MIATTLWIALGIAALLLEAWTIFNHAGGDTLSAHVKRLILTRAGRFVLLPFFAWLGWHWMIEPLTFPASGAVWSDDIAIVAVCAAALALVDRRQTP